MNSSSTDEQKLNACEDEHKGNFGRNAFCKAVPHCRAHWSPSASLSFTCRPLDNWRVLNWWTEIAFPSDIACIGTHKMFISAIEFLTGNSLINEHQIQYSCLCFAVPHVFSTKQEGFWTKKGAYFSICMDKWRKALQKENTDTTTKSFLLKKRPSHLLDSFA